MRILLANAVERYRSPAHSPISSPKRAIDRSIALSPSQIAAISLEVAARSTICAYSFVLQKMTMSFLASTGRVFPRVARPAKAIAPGHEVVTQILRAHDGGHPLPPRISFRPRIAGFSALLNPRSPTQIYVSVFVVVNRRTVNVRFSRYRAKCSQSVAVERFERRQVSESLRYPNRGDQGPSYGESDLA